MRDEFEWHFMQQAVKVGCPIIGVCRGAQMLCALAGGYLIQDVDGHGTAHEVDTYDGKTLVVSSVHHQMMAPWDVEHEMVAWSRLRLSPENYTDVNAAGEDIQVQVPCEPEFVYFPKVKGFAIQWHPEFMENDAPATHYIFNFMKERLNVKELAV
jgi:putative glutamine amidotransferase